MSGLIVIVTFYLIWISSPIVRPIGGREIHYPVIAPCGLLAGRGRLVSEEVDP